MSIRASLSLTLGLLVMMLVADVAQAQTSLDASGVNGGAIIPGEDTDTCDSSKAGAIRYNSTTKKIQICTDKSGSYQWIDWGQ